MVDDAMEAYDEAKDYVDNMDGGNFERRDERSENAVGLAAAFAASALALTATHF